MSCIPWLDAFHWAKLTCRLSFIAWASSIAFSTTWLAFCHSIKFAWSDLFNSWASIMLCWSLLASFSYSWTDWDWYCGVVEYPLVDVVLTSFTLLLSSSFSLVRLLTSELTRFNCSTSSLYLFECSSFSPDFEFVNSSFCFCSDLTYKIFWFILFNKHWFFFTKKR